MRSMTTVPVETLLWQHVRTLPYFRAFLRAIEASFYQGRDLPAPTLDLGSGDGHFAAVTFPRPLDVGLDPWWAPLRAAARWPGHRLRVQADGAAMPFAPASFASAVSNSVLEHIPHVDAVLRETARVLRPGAPFLFTVPNHRFPRQLWGARQLRALGLHHLAAAYGRWFNRISRHAHTDPPAVWVERLQRAGFEVVEHWDYFPPAALAILEWGHPLGLPALLVKALTGRWLLTSARWNVAHLYRWLLPYARQPRHPQGAYTFFAARRRP